MQFDARLLPSKDQLRRIMPIVDKFIPSPLSNTKEFKLFLSTTKKAKIIYTQISKLYAKVSIAGRLRREDPDAEEVVFLVDGDPRIAGMYLDTGSVSQKGEGRVIGTYQGTRVSVHQGSASNWGAMLLYLTGPEEFSMAVRSRAKHQFEMKLSQYGLFDKDGKLIAAKTEKAIFQALKLPYYSPKVRGDTKIANDYLESKGIKKEELHDKYKKPVINFFKTPTARGGDNIK